MDFNENLRDLQHGLQRCEDKLASHDALGGAAKDPKLLDRIKVIFLLYIQTINNTKLSRNNKINKIKLIK